MIQAEIDVPWQTSDVIKAIVVLILLSVPGFLLSLIPFSSGRLISVNLLYSAIVMSLMEGVLILIAWYFGVRKYHTSFDKLGFHSFNILKNLFKAVLWLIALKIFTIVYGAVAILVFDLKPPEELVQGIPNIFGYGIGGIILAIFVVSIIAPIAEETFFRGFVYPALRKKLGVWAGIWTTALIFALFHARVWMIIPVAAMGAALGLLYEQEKSLGPPIMLHSLNNLLSLIIIYAQRG